MASLAGNELGRRGEDLAATHLEGLGLVILTRNWRCREGELDIVATDGLSHLVICEVKPAAAMDSARRRRPSPRASGASCAAWPWCSSPSGARAGQKSVST